MQEFLIQSEYLLRIIVAVICGCIIGYERKNRNKEAGMKTHAIVALGSALIMIVSKGFADIPGADAARIAAQIVSGIGFLGAGIIFVRNNVVSGLTTAAGIWATSGIGMAIGSGNYYIGVMSTILMIVIQIILHSKHFSRDLVQEKVSIIIKNDMAAIRRIEEKLAEENIELTSLEINKLEEDKIKIDIVLHCPLSASKATLRRIIDDNENIITYRVQY